MRSNVNSKLGWQMFWAASPGGRWWKPITPTIKWAAWRTSFSVSPRKAKKPLMIENKYALIPEHEERDESIIKEAESIIDNAIIRSASALKPIINRYKRLGSKSEETAKRIMRELFEKTF